MRRVPSFSERPGFPSGLRVLLVDGDLKACQCTDAQLKDCSYHVTCCSSSAEAVAQLSNPQNNYDLLLAEARTVSSKTADSCKLLKLAKELPFILMAQNPTPEEVMLGIKLGAAEFLEKPLCPLKLRNIWQHTVRKMLRSNISNRDIGGEHQSGSNRSSQELTRCTAHESSYDLTAASSPNIQQLLYDLSPAHSPPALDTSSASSASHGNCSELCLDSRNGSDIVTDEERVKGSKQKESHPMIRSIGGILKQHQHQLSSSCSAPVAPPGSVPPAGLPASGVHGSLGMPSMPYPGSLPWQTPQLPLPPGQVWGMPINPMAQAPGIVPPIFPPPAVHPPMAPTWPMPPFLPGVCAPFGIPPANGFMSGTGMMPFPAAMPPPVAPLPMHMLMSACSSAGDEKPSACQVDLMQQLSMPGKENGMGEAPMDMVDLMDEEEAKMPRCESNLLLPSLEDLMDGDMDFGMAMDLDTFALGLNLKKSDSLADLINETLVAETVA